MTKNCTMCGAQLFNINTASDNCPICVDERQYVNPKGQSWITLRELNLNYRNNFQLVRKGIYAITTHPVFAIGQTAHLIIKPGGNLLWDCIANIDAQTIDFVNNLGGIKAIAISHPHFFTSMIDWSEAFGNVPIYINQRDDKWVFRKSQNIRYWNSNRIELWNGLLLVHCGGHFPGSCVLFSPNKGGGALFVGDTIQVSPDYKSVSFMYSYPNLIPLKKEEINYIGKAISPLQFSQIYGAFGRNIECHAKEVVRFSIERYLTIFNDN